MGTRSGVICMRSRTCSIPPLTTQSSGFEPLLDHSQAVVLERTRRDPAGLDLVVGIEHVDVLPPLVRRDRPINDQERLVRHPDRQRILANLPGDNGRWPPFGSGFAKTPRTRMLPVVGLT